MIKEELEFASPMNPNSSTKDQKIQERLMEEEHAIGWCKEKLKARRGSAQWT